MTATTTQAENPKHENSVEEEEKEEETIPLKVPKGYLLVPEHQVKKKKKKKKVYD